MQVQHEIHNHDTFKVSELPMLMPYTIIAVSTLKIHYEILNTQFWSDQVSNAYALHNKNGKYVLQNAKYHVKCTITTL